MKKLSKTTINLRIDEELKNNAEETLSELGISMTTAITLFLKAVARTNSIPFPITANKKKTVKQVQPLNPRNTVFENGVEDFDLDFENFDSLKDAIDKL